MSNFEFKAGDVIEKDGFFKGKPRVIVEVGRAERGGDQWCAVQCEKFGVSPFPVRIKHRDEVDQEVVSVMRDGKLIFSKGGTA